MYSKLEINQEIQQATFDNGNILFVTTNMGEFINGRGAGIIIVLYKENYYEIKYNDESISYDVYNWEKESPVFAVFGGGGWFGDYEPSLSNTKLQRAGEYRTTILIANGKYDITECLVTFSINSMTGKTYVEDEDYSYNASTGEIVIFNLTEPIGFDIDVDPL